MPRVKKTVSLEENTQSIVQEKPIEEKPIVKRSRTKKIEPEIVPELVETPKLILTVNEPEEEKKDICEEENKDKNYSFNKPKNFIDEVKYNKISSTELASFTNDDLACVLFTRFRKDGNPLARLALEIHRTIVEPFRKPKNSRENGGRVNRERDTFRRKQPEGDGYNTSQKNNIVLETGNIENNKTNFMRKPNFIKEVEKVETKILKPRGRKFRDEIEEAEN